MMAALRPRHPTAIVGFAVLLFTFLGVNFLLKGHHGQFTRW